MDQIVDFIKRKFSQTNANWQNGNCYWFARILCDRFPAQLQIYYLPIEGHFIAGNGEQFYDWTGLLDLKNIPRVPFKNIQETDPTWYYRLCDNCIF